MDLLRHLASDVNATTRTFTSGREVKIASLLIRFPGANPDRLPPGTLGKPYTLKPLVAIDGASMFGELAIVWLLSRDHWMALWVDTFHGGKFWQGMPHVSSPVQPPSQVKDLYDRIADRKGGAGGCFDVVAWKGDRIVWLEYKGPRDKPNPNELRWIEAALGAGVVESDLFFVEASLRKRNSSKPPDGPRS